MTEVINRPLNFGPFCTFYFIAQSLPRAAPARSPVCCATWVAGARLGCCATWVARDLGGARVGCCATWVVRDLGHWVVRKGKYGKNTKIGRAGAGTKGRKLGCPPKVVAPKVVAPRNPGVLETWLPPASPVKLSKINHFSDIFPQVFTSDPSL